ncbi:BrnA antitoxin family protein [uncultured Bradyrhizobium sp.]|uniref:BrnA antitoxin family protein n=1 Tax=uncultured Bradyrhizobium sp. TaxID=199684 RepID=UPI0035C9C8E9
MPEKSKNFSSSLRKRKPWVDPDDAPEWTDDMVARAEVRDGGRIIRRGRPPLGAKAKGVVTIRLDADVLDSYRALGAGWQTRINADLRRARKLKKV